MGRVLYLYKFYELIDRLLNAFREVSLGKGNQIVTERVLFIFIYLFIFYYYYYLFFVFIIICFFSGIYKLFCEIENVFSFQLFACGYTLLEKDLCGRQNIRTIIAS